MMVGRNEGVLRSYLAALQDGCFEGMLSLFSPDALVDSPLYGRIPAREFYRSLFSDTSRSTIHLREIFWGEDPARAAALFHYEWVLRGGASVSFECVDVFLFGKDGRIEELTIIYDTVKARVLLDMMRGSTKTARPQENDK